KTGMTQMYGEPAVHFMLDKNVSPPQESFESADQELKVKKSSKICLRRATSSDCKLLWGLANDPTVRAASFSPKPISWDQHTAWFQSKIETNNCHILIGEENGTVVGQVRIDLRSDGEGEIDVSLTREFRGRGIGKQLIDMALR